MFRKILLVLSAILSVYGLVTAVLSGVNTMFTSLSFFFGSVEQSEAIRPELFHGLFRTTYGIVTVAIYVGLFIGLKKGLKSWIKVSAYGFATAFTIDTILLLLPRGLVERPSSLLHTEFALDLAEFMKIIPYGIFNAFIAIAILFLVVETKATDAKPC